MTDTAKIEAGRALHKEFEFFDQFPRCRCSTCVWNRWIADNADWLLTAAAERDAEVVECNRYRWLYICMEAERDAAVARVREIEAAAAPFFAYSAGTFFSHLPADMVLTKGSPIARQQITAGHFHALRDALSTKPQEAS